MTDTVEPIKKTKRTGSTTPRKSRAKPKEVFPSADMVSRMKKYEDPDGNYRRPFSGRTVGFEVVRKGRVIGRVITSGTTSWGETAKGEPIRDEAGRHLRSADDVIEAAIIEAAEPPRTDVFRYYTSDSVF